MMAIPSSRNDAAMLDKQDPLRDRRDHFDLDDQLIYLDGNSLGAPPKAALAQLRQTAEVEWKQDLIKSWNKAGWIDLPKTCGSKIAKIIGVDQDDVIVADSVSVNIFKLASALWSHSNGAIAYFDGEFPTDGYILQGLSQLIGAQLSKLPDAEPETIPPEIKILVKSIVHYKSAAVADVSAWEEMAARQGLSIIWDLSHAAGILELDLHAKGAKYAIGCGYKFFNGGPGAPAYIYVEKSAAQKITQPLAGWMGHAKPFDFADQYSPAKGVGRFACGTPPILSLCALDAALNIFDGVNMKDVESKSLLLGDLFMARCAKNNLKTISPPVGQKRGAHISFLHTNGYEIIQAMIAEKVIGDFRPPEVLRFGFSPLYIRYSDIWDAADILTDILITQKWRDAAFAVRQKVT